MGYLMATLANLMPMPVGLRVDLAHCFTFCIIRCHQTPIGFLRLGLLIASPFAFQVVGVLGSSDDFSTPAQKQHEGKVGKCGCTQFRNVLQRLKRIA